MPLSPVAQKALEDSARISNENKAKKQAQADQAEGERKQNEQDYNSFIAEQAEIQKQIDQLEAQEKAIEAMQKTIDIIARDRKDEPYDELEGMSVDRIKKIAATYLRGLRELPESLRRK